MNLPVNSNDADEFQSKGSMKGRNLHVSIVELRKFLPIKRMDSGGSLSSLSTMPLPVNSKALELKRPCGGHDRNNSTVSFVQGLAEIAPIVLLPLPPLLPVDKPTPGSTLVKATISRFDSMPVPVTAPITSDKGVKNCGVLGLRVDPLGLTTRG